MLATGEEIVRYIPQREPMIMIHQLVQVSSHHAISGFHILPGNIFVQEGILREAGLVENIAQTAAAQAGYLFNQNNIPIPVGYIAKVKNLEILELPKAGSDIRTTIRVTSNVFDISLIAGEVIWQERLICRCEMSIFVKK